MDSRVRENDSFNERIRLTTSSTGAAFRPFIRRTPRAIRTSQFGVLLFIPILVILANAGIHLSLQLKCLRNLDSRGSLPSNALIGGENDRVNRRTPLPTSSTGAAFRPFIRRTPRAIRTSQFGNTYQTWILPFQITPPIPAPVSMPRFCPRQIAHDFARSFSGHKRSSPSVRAIA